MLKQSPFFVNKRMTNCVWSYLITHLHSNRSQLNAVVNIHTFRAARSFKQAANNLKGSFQNSMVHHKNKQSSRNQQLQNGEFCMWSSCVCVCECVGM